MTVNKFDHKEKRGVIKGRYSLVAKFSPMMLDSIGHSTERFSWVLVLGRNHAMAESRSYVSLQSIFSSKYRSFGNQNE